MEQDKVIEYLSLLQRYNWVMGLVPGINKKILLCTIELKILKLV